MPHIPDWVTELWSEATTWQEVIPGLVWGSGLLVVLLLASPLAWHAVRHIVTTVHEAGHAGVAVLVGRTLAGIRVDSDTSGLTVSLGPRGGLGMVVMLAAGYPAPAVLGLAMAWLIARGYPLASLWLILVVFLAVLIQIRNLYGWWAVGVGLGILIAVIGWAPAPVQVFGAALFAWLLLLGAPRAVGELGRRRSAGSDADQLSQATRLPVWFWVGYFWFVALIGTAIGTWLLLGFGSGLIT